MGSSSSSVTMETGFGIGRCAEGGRGRPRSYECVRSVGDAVVVEDRVGRAEFRRSSSVM